MKRVLSCLVAMLITVGLVTLAADIGQIPARVELSEKTGGRVDGTAWSSSEIRGKVYTLMYVDPDEKEMNVHVEQALKKMDFPKDRYGSIAVINMEATWKPNAIINSILRKKQEEFPDTIYVRDMDFYLAHAWNLQEKSSYAVLTFAPDGRLLFQKDGKLSDADVAELIGIIQAQLAAVPGEPDLDDEAE